MVLRLSCTFFFLSSPSAWFVRLCSSSSRVLISAIMCDNVENNWDLWRPNAWQTMYSLHPATSYGLSLIDQSSLSCSLRCCRLGRRFRFSRRNFPRLGHRGSCRLLESSLWLHFLLSFGQSFGSLIKGLEGNQYLYICRGNVEWLDNSLSKITTPLKYAGSISFLLVGDAGNHYIVRIVVITAFIFLTDFDFPLVNIRLASSYLCSPYACFTLKF